jgi:hypothetical protein
MWHYNRYRGGHWHAYLRWLRHLPWLWLFLGKLNFWFELLFIFDLIFYGLLLFPECCALSSFILLTCLELTAIDRSASLAFLNSSPILLQLLPLSIKDQVSFFVESCLLRSFFSLLTLSLLLLSKSLLFYLLF